MHNAADNKNKALIRFFIESLRSIGQEVRRTCFFWVSRESSAGWGGTCSWSKQGMEAKYAQMSAKLNAGGVNPYIDPQGYKSYVAEREQAFRSELQKQTAAAKKQ